MLFNTTGYKPFLTMDNLEATKADSTSECSNFKFKVEYESKPESQSLKSTNPNLGPNLNFVN